MELGTPSSTPPPSGMRRLVWLIGAVVVLLVLLVLPDLLGYGRRKDPDFLADLPSAASEIDGLREDLGATRGPVPGLDLDAPLDLTGGGPSVPPPTAAPTPGATVGIPVPSVAPAATPAATPATASPAPTSVTASGSAASTGIRLRPVDYRALLAAHAAGDVDYLKSVLLDPSYLEEGRMLALALLSTFEGSGPTRVLTELLEDQAETFPLREAAVYALLRMEGPRFGSYLARVAERPGVAAGKDLDRSRLVVLGFYADQQVGTGAALGEAAPALMRMARDGNRTAMASLSFALATGDPREGELPLLEARDDEPVVSRNLIRYYRRLVEAGRAEHQQRLKELEAKAIREL